MPKIKINPPLIVAVIFLLSACKPATEKSFDIGTIRINPNDIVLVD